MFTEDQARKLFASNWWTSEKINDWERHKTLAIFQLSQNVLCMPYGVFHAAVEIASAEGFRPDKLAALRFDLLQKLTGSKYSKTDEECLQLLPLSARETLR